MLKLATEDGMMSPGIVILRTPEDGQSVHPQIWGGVSCRARTYKVLSYHGLQLSMLYLMQTALLHNEGQCTLERRGRQE